MLGSMPWPVTTHDLAPGDAKSAELDLAQLNKVLTSEVKIFAFTHVSNTLGVINPVAQLCAGPD